MKKNILVTVAMEKEEALIGGVSSLFHEVSIRTVTTGIGKVNASAVLSKELLCSCKPYDLVISAGCAGSLSDDFRIGDVVTAQSVTYHDVWCGKPNIRGQVQGMPLKFFCDPVWMHTGKHANFLSGDWFVDNPSMGRLLQSEFPDCGIVDMESGAMAQVCHIYGIPFTSVRIVSDACYLNSNKSDYEAFWSTTSKLRDIYATELKKVIKSFHHGRIQD